jgi:cyclin-dependent kinase regulatory subunit CKS1
MAVQDIEYSDKYEDSTYEYRHVILPKELSKRLPHPARLLSETEWRGLGIMQSRGWVHYEIHKPEPHIILFRRELGTDPRTGKVNPLLRESALTRIEKERKMQ